MTRQTYDIDSTDLPALDPHTHCVLMPRDPDFIYAYWDYSQEDIDQLRHKFRIESAEEQLFLRVYDITHIEFDGSNARHTWDIEVDFSSRNRYIHVWQDNADYCVALGMFSSEDHFIPLVRSNMARTPPKSASKRDDLIWQDIKVNKESQPYIKEDIHQYYQDLIQQHSKKKSTKAKHPPKAQVFLLSPQDIKSYYMRLFSGVSKKGRGHGLTLEDILKSKLKGSLLQKVEPRLSYPDLLKKIHPGASQVFLEKGSSQEHVSSPAGASENSGFSPAGASEGRLRKRKFFFEVSTELIVHGRTEPDAAVWLNHQGVKLNPDGTFSLRYSLPDGEIPLKFIAQSSDGVEQRHINTGVERAITIGFPKMLKAFDA